MATSPDVFQGSEAARLVSAHLIAVERVDLFADKIIGAQLRQAVGAARERHDLVRRCGDRLDSGERQRDAIP